MLKEKSLRLMGATITVTEKYKGEFEEQRLFIEENKHLFKYGATGNAENLPQRIVIPKPKFPSHVMNHIRSVEGANLAFLTSKRLQATDVEIAWNRLYVLKSETLSQNLSKYETEQIEKQSKEGGGLEVMAIDQRGETYSLTMRLWSNASLNKEWIWITKEWAKLVRDNKLQKGDLVEIWCFRVGRIERKLRLVVSARRERIQNY